MNARRHHQQQPQRHRSLDPKTFRASAALTLAALLVPLAWGPAAAAEEPSAELTVESERPERGHYRLRAERRVQASPEQLLAMLTDFEEHCEEGCRYPLPSLERVEILEQSEEGALTWTRVDDVMDAHYFTRATVSRESAPAGEIVRLQLDFLAEDELGDLVTKERPHDPFFYQQSVAWALEPAEDGGTRASVTMEMRSRKFLINLAPKKVLAGSRSYLERVFGHLESLGAEAPEPPEGDSTPGSPEGD
ncbi:MAG: SRPBCC family protein [Acidobacteriota bacterium]